MVAPRRQLSHVLVLTLPPLHLQIAWERVGCSRRYGDLVGEKGNTAVGAGPRWREMVARVQTTSDRAGGRLTLNMTQAGRSSNGAAGPGAPGEAGWGLLSPISPPKTPTEMRWSHKLDMALSKGHFSAAGFCQILPALTQGLIYPLRSAFHVSLPKEGLG